MSNPAESYENGAVPIFFAPWSAHLLRAAAPQPGERVLDVGTGTGIVARLVSPLVRSNGTPGAVVGLDLNPAMLAVAHAAAQREGFTIDWREGRAEELPFPDASFDLVLSQFALMFFTDPRVALAEMHRVLTPGGRVALSVFQSIERHPFYQALDAAIHRHLGVPVVQAIYALGDLDRLRHLLSAAGFHAIHIHPVSMTNDFGDPEEFLAAEIELDTAAIPAMQHLNTAARRAMIAAIQDDMAEPLRRATHDNHVILPFHAYLVRAQR